MQVRRDPLSPSRLSPRGSPPSLPPPLSLLTFPLLLAFSLTLFFLAFLPSFNLDTSLPSSRSPPRISQHDVSNTAEDYPVTAATRSVPPVPVEGEKERTVRRTHWGPGAHTARTAAYSGESASPRAPNILEGPPSAPGATSAAGSQAGRHSRPGARSMRSRAADAELGQRRPAAVQRRQLAGPGRGRLSHGRQLRSWHPADVSVEDEANPAAMSAEEYNEGTEEGWESDPELLLALELLLRAHRARLVRMQRMRHARGRQHRRRHPRGVYTPDGHVSTRRAGWSTGEGGSDAAYVRAMDGDRGAYYEQGRGEEEVGREQPARRTRRHQRRRAEALNLDSAESENELLWGGIYRSSSGQDILEGRHRRRHRDASLHHDATADVITPDGQSPVTEGSPEEGKLVAEPAQEQESANVEERDGGAGTEGAASSAAAGIGEGTLFRVYRDSNGRVEFAQLASGQELEHDTEVMHNDKIFRVFRDPNGRIMLAPSSLQETAGSSEEQEAAEVESQGESDYSEGRVQGGDTKGVDNTMYRVHRDPNGRMFYADLGEAEILPHGAEVAHGAKIFRVFRDTNGRIKFAEAAGDGTMSEEVEESETEEKEEKVFQVFRDPNGRIEFIELSHSDNIPHGGEVMHGDKIFRVFRDPNGRVVFTAGSQAKQGVEYSEAEAGVTEDSGEGDQRMFRVFRDANGRMFFMPVDFVYNVPDGSEVMQGGRHYLLYRDPNGRVVLDEKSVSTLLRRGSRSLEDGSVGEEELVMHRVFRDSNGRVSFRDLVPGEELPHNSEVFHKGKHFWVFKDAEGRQKFHEVDLGGSGSVSAAGGGEEGVGSEADQGEGEGEGSDERIVRVFRDANGRTTLVDVASREELPSNCEVIHQGKHYWAMRDPEGQLMFAESSGSYPRTFDGEFDEASPGNVFKDPNGRVIYASMEMDPYFQANVVPQQQQFQQQQQQQLQREEGAGAEESYDYASQEEI